jgi:hypothetical protein
MEKIDVINGHGLDILEEFGIHVIDKKPSQPAAISLLRQSLNEAKKDLEDRISLEEMHLIFGPVEDLIAIADKWEATKLNGPTYRFYAVIASLIMGYIQNPAFIELVNLDIAKRILQISKQDPLSVLREGIEANKETSRLIAKI